MTKLEVMKLTWERDTHGWRGYCGTHVYRIREDDGIVHLFDNQNGWDCYSTRAVSVRAAKIQAQDHFETSVRSMIKENYSTLLTADTDKINVESSEN